MNRVGNHEAHAYIARHEEFTSHTKSFRGVVERRNAWSSVGMLPPSMKHGLDDAIYVVYSYNTPIAWFSGGTWYYPEVKYSRTTTHHQSQTRWGIQESGERAVALRRDGLAGSIESVELARTAVS